jgi:hypothetical protein
MLQILFLHKKISNMKTKCYLCIAFSLLASLFLQTGNAQANTELSNLISPTKVNQSLIPITHNSKDLGTASVSWRTIYLAGSLYLDGRRFLSNGNDTTNVFVGSNAGNKRATSDNPKTGKFNTASGQYALYSYTSGDRNTANGAEALYSNTTGYDNNATGYNALFSNTTGDLNTANGYKALYYNSTGCCNTAIGYYSLYSNTTGYANTAIGYGPLYSNTIGGYNTALGSYADVSTGNLTNATAIGYAAIVNASNKVRIGNTSVTSIGGQVGWSIFSDARYKKDIKENVLGLAFINSLRPITYTVNVQGLNEYFNKGRKQLSDNEDEVANAEMKKAEEAAAKIVYNGFIAQEVEEAAKQLNFEFSGIDKPQSKDGLYALRYDNFIVPLVKAVQELSQMSEGLRAENDEKDVRINNLQKQIDELKAIVLRGNPQTGTNTKITNASLAQNIPNPFTNATTIKYTLPSKFTSAQIIITDKNGKQLKQLNISGSASGSLRVDASTLSSGTYAYSLVIDGKIISTKQMVVVK